MQERNSYLITNVYSKSRDKDSKDNNSYIHESDDYPKASYHDMMGKDNSLHNNRKGSDMGTLDYSPLTGTEDN